MRLPGTLPAGQRISALTEQVDIAPTVMELLGKEVPPSVQGTSLLPLINDPDSPHKDAVFSQGGVEPAATRKPGLDYEVQLDLSPYWNKQRTLIEYPDALVRAHMVRTEHYKLIYRLAGDHEFYDLRNDPSELENLYNREEFCNEVAKLEQRLLRFFVENQSQDPVIDELWA
jgi:arylsulfatase A-like enzyme